MTNNCSLCNYYTNCYHLINDIIICSLCVDEVSSKVNEIMVYENIKYVLVGDEFNPKDLSFWPYIEDGYKEKYNIL